MLYKLLLLMVVLPCISIQAQTLHSAVKYQSLYSEVLQTYVDHTGARYTLMSPSHNFEVDSLGTPITIVPNAVGSFCGFRNSLVLIKYNAQGNYLYHVKIRGLRADSCAFKYILNTAIDYNNDVTMAFAAYGFDSVELVNANNTRFKKLTLFATFKQNNMVVCKLNSNGQFAWASGIELSTAPFNFSGSLTHNAANAATLYLNMPNNADTLLLTDNNGQQSPIYLNQADLRLTFAANGSLQQYTNGFNVKQHPSANSTYVHKSVSDGNNTFSLVFFRLAAKDTLAGPVPLALDTGNTLVLIKTNSSHNVVWAIPLIQPPNNSLWLEEYPLLAYEPTTQKVAVGINFNSQNWNKFASGIQVNPPPATSLGLIFLATITTHGQISWYGTVGNYDEGIIDLGFSPVTKGLVLSGRTSSNEPFTIGNYTLNINRNTQTFVAFFDSLNQCLGALAIKNIKENGISLEDYNYTGYIGSGSTFIDQQGRAYLTGRLSGKIDLYCNKTLTSGMPPYNNWLWFELIVAPPFTITDTTVCVPLLSPSGKYTYTQNGIYTDTIMTTELCDSIIKLRVTILKSQSVVDTNVCYQLVSPSGKYTYTTNGTYYDTIPNYKGCDSIITLKVQVQHRTDTLTITQCKPYQSPSGKYTYNTSGQYFDTLTTAAGCDSVLLINFTTQQNTATLTINTCSPYITPSGKDTLTQSGVYTDTLTNQFNCDSVITITLNKQTFTVQATSANEVSCDTPFTQLGATAAVSYRWSPADYLSDATIANPLANPMQNITYTVTATNQIGCTSTDSVNVVVKRVEKAYTIPNVFTPNADGYNDCFPLVNESKLTSVSFTVYNRWGNEVYSTTNPNACWTGTDNNNNAVPAGVYYYVLSGQNNCGTPFTTNGSIQVLK